MSRFNIPLLTISLGSLFLLHSCKTHLKQEAVSKGEADFSRYVAIGNSLTAGYADGALSLTGQQNAYPLMLSRQFQDAGGGIFTVPYMNPGGGTDASGNPRRVLGYVLPCNSSTPTLAPVLDPQGSTAPHNVSAAGPYHLVGVPGARAIDGNQPLLGMFNPFFQRFCKTPGSSTMLSEALRTNPSFFTLWLGSNDVLLYALGGAVPPSGPFSPSISDPNAVKDSLTHIVQALVNQGAKGAIANVPDVTSIPHFTTIPWNGVVLSQGKADTLNSLYQSLMLTHITWKAGQNGFVIVDTSAPGDMRQMTSGEYVLLVTPSDSLSCGQWGTNPMKPLQDRYILDKDEVSAIQQATTQYNTAIANIAVTYNLALVDIHQFLKTVKSGLLYNGVNFTTAFVSGGSFSLDGVHPTARGYAMIANEFIKSINKRYGSTIREVNPLSYDAVIFP